MTNEELIVHLSHKLAEAEKDRDNFNRWWGEARKDLAAKTNELSAAATLIAEQGIKISELQSKTN